MPPACHDAESVLNRPQGSDERLTGNRVLARNTLWNLIGQTAPLAAVLIAVPPLVRALGMERFGVLSLAWMIAGYFSLFDLGLGWALTCMLSEKLAAARHEELPALAWTSLSLLLILGVVGGLALAAAAPLLVHRALRLPPGLGIEALSTFRLLAVAVPVVVLTSGVNGMLAAHQRFGLINIVRMPLSVASYFAPLAVLPWTHRLEPVVAVLVCSRVAALLVVFVLGRRAMPELRRTFEFSSSLVPGLLGFGGWMTVTNVVGPVMVYLDRLLVGTLLGAAAVTFYATPFDVSSRIWLLSSPAVAVLFPAFAATSNHDPHRMARLFDHGLRWAFLTLFPCALVLVAFAHEGLQAWLGAEFAARSTRVLQWLAAGMFVNGLAQVAIALVQGAGRPSWSARLHLAELPLYLTGLWWLIRTRGIEGAAIAWVARASVDAAALFLMSRVLLRGTAAPMQRNAAVLAAALAALAAAFFLEGWRWKSAFVVLLLTPVMIAAWKLVIVPVRRGLAPEWTTSGAP